MRATRPPQRLPRARATRLVGVRRASRVGARAGAVPAAALLGAGRRRCTAPPRSTAFLRWTEQPLVKAREIALVLLLAVHLAGGLRLLLVEFVGWRATGRRPLIAAAGGVARRVRAAVRAEPASDRRRRCGVDPGTTSRGRREGALHPRAEGSCRPTSSAASTRCAARETDATAQARARHDGREHRGRRAHRQPAVPGHRHPDLQRDDRPRRRRSTASALKAGDRAAAASARRASIRCARRSCIR